jgi:hypothetical protein
MKITRRNGSKVFGNYSYLNVETLRQAVKKLDWFNACQ